MCKDPVKWSFIIYDMILSSPLMILNNQPSFYLVIVTEPRAHVPMELSLNFI